MHTVTHAPTRIHHGGGYDLSPLHGERGLLPTPVRWFARVTEYAVGAAMVLAHLALAGRIPTLVDRFERLEERRHRHRPRLELG